MKLDELKMLCYAVSNYPYNRLCEACNEMYLADNTDIGICPKCEAKLKIIGGIDNDAIELAFRMINIYEDILTGDIAEELIEKGMNEKDIKYNEIKQKIHDFIEKLAKEE